MSRGAASLALALLLLGALNVRAADADELAAAGPERASPGVWPERVYRWSYNPQGHPAWLSDAQASEWVQEAAKKWEACGVRMEYLGETQRPPFRRDGANVVGWRSKLPGGARGVTAGPAARGVLVERDIAYDPAREEFRRYPRLLKKVLVHEFGHAIGLTHSAACHDVMTLAADCPRAAPSELPLEPTPNDLARCKALYP